MFVLRRRQPQFQQLSLVNDRVSIDGSRQRPSAGTHVARGRRRSPRVTALETRPTKSRTQWCTRRIIVIHRTFDFCAVEGVYTGSLRTIPKYYSSLTVEYKQSQTIIVTVPIPVSVHIASPEHIQLSGLKYTCPSRDVI